MFKREVMIFAGNANIPLAERVANYLNLPLGQALVSRFSDGETHVEIQENVRGRDVFIVQPTSRPTNDHLMELIVMADALRRASAYRVTAVMPYYGYSRQDRRAHSKRVPITAKVVADMLQSAGIDRVLTIDLHADQIQGFFNIPVDNAYGSQLLTRHILSENYGELVVVSPDIGGVVRARATAKLLNDADLAIIDKRRPEPNRSEIMNIIGEVESKTCILVDDMVDTAGTLCNAAQALKERGAKAVYAYATHPILSGNAIENIRHSQLDKLVVTDTIALQPEAESCERIKQVTAAELLAETIHRIHRNESVSSLYD